jgi:hypothetical protein
LEVVVVIWRYFRKHAWVTRCLNKSTKVYAEQVALLEEYRRLEPPAAFIIKPEKMPAADFVTRNGNEVNLTIDAGYRSVKSMHDQLTAFLSPETARSRRAVKNEGTGRPSHTANNGLGRWSWPVDQRCQPN